MGYTTYFNGALDFNREVTPQMKEYINRFSSTRRMPRDVEKIKEIYPNWKELCFFGDLGEKGAYFAPIDKEYGQVKDDSILDYNAWQVSVHPGLWCQWIINDENQLVWDEGEKFYNYTEWLEYMIENFFEPLGYVLNGQIDWQGEESDDRGAIVVVNNQISILDSDEIVLKGVGDDDLIEELSRRGYKVV